MENRLDGLPKYGVTLSGSPENPIIENRSGRAVIGYRLKTVDQNGHGPASDATGIFRAASRDS
jgi:hypothetical protein